MFEVLTEELLDLTVSQRGLRRAFYAVNIDCCSCTCCCCCVI